MKVSIIIPTIGRKTLQAVLESIYASNDFEKLKPEIVVVFDGEQNLKLSENPALKVFETGKKVFAGGARNLGIEKSTGDILVFIGDDTMPQKNWLQKIYAFHQKFPEKEKALLGKVSWVEALAKDRFHKFLDNGVQFDFSFIKKNGATWRHFYTSNISLKKSFIGEERFSDRFDGWGFEDIEFGYRLSKKGLNMTYDENCEVLHDDHQTFSAFIERTKQARINAKIFEALHPEIKILPRGKKLIILKILLAVTWFLLPYSKKTFWWREWKKAWIGEGSEMEK